MKRVSIVFKKDGHYAEAHVHAADKLRLLVCLGRGWEAGLVSASKQRFSAVSKLVVIANWQVG
jgi:hypothetical protein